MKNTKRVAFITGVTGQDGAHLAGFLISKGYTVFGGYRRGINKTWRLDYLGITNKIRLVEFHLNELQNIIVVLQKIKPTHLYHLAAESYVADSFNHPNMVLESNTLATCNILEAIRIISPSTRLFFASSSEIFGHCASGELLNESSVRYPENPYAISKMSSDYFIQMYRNKYGIFACSGILFNHEGPLRGGQFVSRKITHNVARLKSTNGEPVILGNLSASRDWGAAVDFVKAMVLMLEAENPEDFVIATGKLSSVRDFLRLSALEVGFDPVFDGEGENELCIDKGTGMKIAEVSKLYFREFDTPALVGDPLKIESNLGWRRDMSFGELIANMVKADLDRWAKGVLDI